MGVSSPSQYTIIDGKVYDISSFMGHHPGGRALLSMAVGRDATIMFESYHMRHEVAKQALQAIPRAPKDVTPETLIEGKHGPFDPIPADDQALETYPTPMKSELYRAIQKRVREELLAPQGKKRGRGGSAVFRDAMITTTCWVLATLYFLYAPSILSGCILGLMGAWMGFGVQHTANHGGLTENYRLNAALGWLDDIACGGSSLVWRYHHHVSHHVYTNDQDKDQDVYSSYPMMRLDDSQARSWYHAAQWIYGPLMFSLLYFSVQMQDFASVLGNNVFYVNFHGVTRREQVEFLLGKVVHFGIYLGLPIYWHGLYDVTNVWLPFLSFALCGGLCLSWFFIVSHNVMETKPSLLAPGAKKDWAQWQIETSATWGGRIASFFTGGLCFQIEHHLFPGAAHNLYPDIAVIVQEECSRRNVPYHGYDTLWAISYKMVEFLYRMGTEDKPKLVLEAKKTL